MPDNNLYTAAAQAAPKQAANSTNAQAFAHRVEFKQVVFETTGSHA